MRELRGLVIVVVGGTGGLGRPIVDALRTRGAIVVTAARHDADIVLDLRDSRAGDVLVAAAQHAHGRLDGVVVAAGVVAFGELATADDAIVEELFLTNVLGPLWLARRVLAPLAATKGFFAAITGVVAEQSLPGIVPYSASKAALSSALSGWRREARRVGVHVLDARPPHTETGLASRPLEGVAPRFPVGLAPESVAEQIVAAIEAGATELPAASFT
jgi:short-subunit dehydrogenase